MPARKKTSSPKDSSANLGFEAKLWLAADKLRNNMDDVLVFRRVHVVAELIGREPELGLEAEVGGGVG